MVTNVWTEEGSGLCCDRIDAYLLSAAATFEFDDTAHIRK